MASDMYMKLQGIDGDSTDEKHPKWIEMLSFSVGHALQMDGTKSKGTRSSGKANFQDMTVSKQMDSTSPQLADHVARGQHIPEITIELCRATGEKTVYMKYVLKDVVISSYSTGGSTGGGEPIETLTFDYAEIHWVYTPANVKGVKAADMKKGWSLEANKAVTPA
jgi:type VI secretion system secreted protein Hcp